MIPVLLALGGAFLIWKMRDESINDNAVDGVTGATMRGVDNRVSSLKPETRAAVVALQEALKKVGAPLVIFETKRSRERQEYLYRKGRTAEEIKRAGIEGDPLPGPKVTWTLQSRHMTGRAVDFVLDVDSPYWGDSPPSSPWDYSAKTRSVWDVLGVFAEREGLVWGGRWKTPDFPHVELRE